MTKQKCIINKESILTLIEVLADEIEDDSILDALARTAEKLESIPECTTSKKSRGKRKPSARSEFLSHCMKKAGLGLPLGTCQGKFKNLPETEIEKYQALADEKE